MRPANVADEWEKSALQKFEEESKEVLEFTSFNGEPFLRFMQPLVAKQGCLKCHAHQGYKVGDIRGGVSISLPLKPYTALEQRIISTSILTHIVIYLFGLLFIGLLMKIGREQILAKVRSEHAILKLNRGLKDRVKAKTFALSEANKKLKTEIADRKKDAKARKRSETKFRSLFDFSSDVIMLLDDKGFFNCNKATLQIFGCETEDYFFLNHPADLSPSTQPDGRDSMALANEHMLKAVEHGSHRFEWVHKRISGEEFFAEVLLNALELDGKQIIQAVVRDITDRKQAEEELIDAHQNLQTVLNASSQVSIISTDSAGIIKTFNIGAEQMLGYSSEEMIGKQTPALIHLESEMIAHGKKLTKEFGRPIEGFEVFKAKVQHGGNEERRWTYVKKDGTHITVNLGVTAITNSSGNMAGLLGIALDVTELQQTEEELKRLAVVVEQSHTSIIITDVNGIITYVNPAFENMTEYSSDEAIGNNPNILKSDEQDDSFYKNMWDTIQSGKVWNGRIINQSKSGKRIEENMIISPVRNKRGKIVNYVALKYDMSEQIRLEMELHQAQKLESIGQLAAGIAHEINTPIQFIGDSMYFMKEAYTDLTNIIAQYDELLQKAERIEEFSEKIEGIKDLIEDSDLEFLLEEIPQSLERVLNGVERISTIVMAMKEFSHPGAKEKQAIDINRVIETTLTVSRNEYKYIADVETNYGSIPLVELIPGDLNQVLINMIVNSVHAIEDKIGDTGERGAIRIKTELKDNNVIISVSDTGNGIPKEIQNKIFDPFFTTKEVGKGSGQGLAISHSIVVDKHGGKLSIDTKPGQGTTFYIQIPVDTVINDLGGEYE